MVSLSAAFLILVWLVLRIKSPVPVSFILLLLPSWKICKSSLVPNWAFASSTKSNVLLVASKVTWPPSKSTLPSTSSVSHSSSPVMLTPSALVCSLFDAL